MKLIDKAAVVAEIERRKHKLLDNIMFERDKEWVVRTAHQLNRIILFLDDLEVKEVDLEKEMSEYFVEHPDEFFSDKYKLFAKHFFELGLRSTITEEDCKLIWNIGDETPNMPEEEFFKELLKRYKAQKREEV